LAEHMTVARGYVLHGVRSPQDGRGKKNSRRLVET
jgi:hypothetical protein